MRQITDRDVLGTVNVINDLFGRLLKACCLVLFVSPLARPPRRRATPASAASISVIDRLCPRCLPRAPGKEPRSRRALPGLRVSAVLSRAGRAAFGGAACNRFGFLSASLHRLALRYAPSLFFSRCGLFQLARFYSSFKLTLAFCLSSALRLAAARCRNTSGSLESISSSLQRTVHQNPSAQRLLSSLGLPVSRLQSLHSQPLHHLPPPPVARIFEVLTLDVGPLFSHLDIDSSLARPTAPVAEC